MGSLSTKLWCVPGCRWLHAVSAVVTTVAPQLAFSPALVVPGIYYSDDKLFQSRIFSYADTQRYRCGQLQIPCGTRLSMHAAVKFQQHACCSSRAAIHLASDQGA